MTTYQAGNEAGSWDDAIIEQNLALLKLGMICPHPQPFSLGRRELEFMFPLLLGEG